MMLAGGAGWDFFKGVTRGVLGQTPSTRRVQRMVSAVRRAVRCSPFQVSHPPLMWAEVLPWPLAHEGLPVPGKGVLTDLPGTMTPGAVICGMKMGAFGA